MAVWSSASRLKSSNRFSLNSGCAGDVCVYQLLKEVEATAVPRNFAIIDIGQRERKVIESPNKKRVRLVGMLGILLLAYTEGVLAGAEDTVPLGIIQKIASDNARSLWGDVYGTEAIPYYGLNDEIIAYIFNFSMNRSFPPHDWLKERADQARRDGRETERWGVGEYCHLVVSARYSMPPIPAYSRCLSEEFACDYELRELARETLGTTAVELVKVYYVTPSQKWYMYRSAGESVFIRIFPPPTVYFEDEFNMNVKQELGLLKKEDFRELWHEFESGKTISSKADHFVPMQELCPFYDWSYGCSPTAGAMLLAYWDNYGLYDADDYATLVDFHFQRWDGLQGETDYQVPNVQRELAIAMGTDTLTGSTNTGFIPAGIVHVANTINSYGFLSWNIFADASVLWDTVTAEVNAGRPWHCGVPGHSMTGIGYTDDNYIIVHNTWNPPNAYWYYTEMYRCGKVIPGSPYGNSVRVTGPMGDTAYNHNGSGEVWNSGATHEVMWARDTSFGYVIISLSTDGGASGTWSIIEDSSANDGSWFWTIPLAMFTTQARISVDLRGGDGNVLGCDGSFGNFIIEAIPEITVTPSSFDTALIQGATATKVMTIGNAGSDTLHFTITDSTAQLFKEMHEVGISASDRVNSRSPDLGEWSNPETGEGTHWEPSGHLSSDPSDRHPSIYMKRSDWLSEFPDTGSVPPGGLSEITVTLDATGLSPGDYGANIIISSNDPENPVSIVPVALAVAPQYACGDCNGDGWVTFADALYLKNHYYQTPPGSPAPIGEGDVNLDGQINFADALYIKNYYYQSPPGSPPPCEPTVTAPFRKRRIER